MPTVRVTIGRYGTGNVVSDSAPEDARLAALYTYGLLDAVRPVVLDDLTRLAARIFDTPMSTVTLVDRDRQWFAGKTGMDGSQAPRSISFCARMIDDPRPLIVPDARLDPRFRDYSNVTGAPFIRFYAGVPLVSEDGLVLGSVCVLDRDPREIGASELGILGDLAAQAAGHLAAIREQTRLAVLDRELTRLSQREMDLVATVSHELRTPVATMQGYLEMLSDDEDLAPYRKLLDPIRRNGDRLVRMVDHLLAGTGPDDEPARPDGLVDLVAAVRSAIEANEPLSAERDVRLVPAEEREPIHVVGEAAALGQALVHLLRNAILFSKTGDEVRVRIALNGGEAKVEIADAGAGIPATELPYVFERFYRGRYAQEQAVPGMGLGLSIAWRIITAHGGRLSLASPGSGRGTRAGFWLPAAG